MKSLQKGLLAVSALVVSTGVFAQVRVGASGRAHTKVNTTVVNRTTAKAATATTKATNRAANATQKAVNKTTTTATNAATNAANTQVKAKGRVNSQGSVHASETGKQHASEKSVLSTGVEVNGSATTPAVGTTVQETTGAATEVGSEAKGNAVRERRIAEAQAVETAETGTAVINEGAQVQPDADAAATTEGKVKVKDNKVKHKSEPDEDGNRVKTKIKGSNNIETGTDGKTKLKVKSNNSASASKQ